jgi:hypothetical protein
MFYQKPLQEHAKEMRALAKFLVPNTFPLVTIEEEQKIIVLKQRQLFVDGYELTIICSRAAYSPESEIESLQISAFNAPFLPFRIVCKIAKIFLGCEYLGYTNFFKNGQQIYCWTLRYQDGEKAPATNRSNISEFEGFEYRTLHVNSNESDG